MLNAIAFYLLSWIFVQAWATPMPNSGVQRAALHRRTEPFFPDQPESCQFCAKDYDSIRSCAEAAPVLQNFTTVMFNPGAFIDTIQCACTDTFKAVFPQCADCFIRTGQEDVLAGHDLPSVVSGIRKVCAVASTLMGNVTNSNNDPATPAPSSTGSKLEGVPVHMMFVAVGASFAATFATFIS